MNIDNIKLLRNHIAKLSGGDWSINSGAKCFLGHINKINDAISYSDFFGFDVFEDDTHPLIAYKLLGDAHLYTIPVACAVLDNLIATGKVDWDYAIANPAKLDEVI